MCVLRMITEMQNFVLFVNVGFMQKFETEPNQILNYRRGVFHNEIRIVMTLENFFIVTCVSEGSVHNFISPWRMTR